MPEHQIATQEAESLPPGHRMTELGPLPEEWKVVRLGEVFNLVPKQIRKHSIQDKRKYMLITVQLYAKGIRLREVALGEKIKAKSLYMVRSGDFVFSKIDARNGAWGFVPEQLDGSFVSGDFPILKLDRSAAHDLFLTLVLSRPQMWRILRNFAVGTTNRRRIQPQELMSYLVIPLPPLSEQRAIAYVLRTVQEAKEATERVIAVLRELKKSLMRHLFTYGPVPVDAIERVELQETEIGPIPKHWKVVRLGEVAMLKLGRTPPRAESRYWENGAVPWVSIADLNNSHVLTTKERISEVAYEQFFGGRPVPAGTLLLSFKLTIGKVGILSMPAVHNEAIVSSYPQEDAQRDYLFYLFQGYDFDFVLDSYVKGKTLNKEKLERLIIPLPPLSEQQEIARILRSVDERIEAEEKKKAALEALFKTLLHHLMTAKIRLPEEFVKGFSKEGLKP